LRLGRHLHCLRGAQVKHDGVRATNNGVSRSARTAVRFPRVAPRTCLGEGFPTSSASSQCQRGWLRWVLQELLWCRHYHNLDERVAPAPKITSPCTQSCCLEAKSSRREHTIAPLRPKVKSAQQKHVRQATWTNDRTIAQGCRQQHHAVEGALRELQSNSGPLPPLPAAGHSTVQRTPNDDSQHRACVVWSTQVGRKRLTRAVWAALRSSTMKSARYRSWCPH
jgi:hypothetical protein